MNSRRVEYPKLSPSRIWSRLTMANVSKVKKRKLGPYIVNAVFIGYARDNSAYRFLIIKLEVQGIDPYTIIESRDAIIFENRFPSKSKVERFLPMLCFLLLVVVNLLFYLILRVISTRK